jgi:hypothetical protein
MSCAAIPSEGQTENITWSARGYDVSLTRYPEGWHATFLARDHTTRPWVGQVFSFHETPWRAVQHAAWTVLDTDQLRPSRDRLA